MTAESPGTVNPHYLDHVVATSESSEVEVTEEIVSRNGIRLLAKGARIDAAMRERLLEHKLHKPLEDCVQVVGGVVAERFEPIGEILLDKHPLLRALCASDRSLSAPASLAALSLSLPIRSLLTIYAQSQEGRLDHAVGVAMLALSLVRRLVPGEIDRHRVTATAGLVHDVGELYIDPAYLRRDARLDAVQWRHIVTHPLVGHRVLRDMEGAGPAVADAVLLHHERLDGFGYPRGVGGEAFTNDGQILAVSEWLMAMVESGRSPLARARMVDRLVPGEIGPALLKVIAAAAAEATDEPVEISSAPPLEQAVPRILHLASALRRFGQARAFIGERIAEAGPSLRSVLEAGVQRLLRIQASFSSTGLDVHDPQALLGELAALRDPEVYVEIMTLVGELEWRLREVERGQRLRASLLPAPERAVIEDLLARLKGAPAEATAADT